MTSPLPSDDALTADSRPVYLFATVGGSPQPIISAMRALKPEAVCFIVSRTEAETLGSRSQVDDETITLDSGTGEKGPGLRHQPDCPRDHVQVCETPADDPDKTFEHCRNRLLEAQARCPGHRFVADYTGGTKSMTGGLLMAALSVEGVDVQFMAGQRRSLVQIAAGTEAPRAISSEAVLIDREMRRIESLTANHDYAAASQLATALKKRAESSAAAQKATRKRIARASLLLNIFALWDSFQHGEAARRARVDFEKGGEAGDALQAMGLYEPLLQLADEGRDQSNWRVCADLWLNAQRCAERGRYDDAVARLYRLTEAAVQAQLWGACKIPSPPPWDSVPDDLRKGIRPMQERDARGREYQAAGLGLERCVQLLQFHAPDDPLAEAAVRGGMATGRPSWTSKRNKSILAHGFNSLQAENWGEASQWIERHFRVFWRAVEPPQLPRSLDASDPRGPRGSH